MRLPRLPYAVLGFGVLAFAWAPIFVRIADQEVHALTIASWRFLFATALMLPVAAVLFARGRISIPPRAGLLMSVLAGVFQAAHVWTWFASFEHTSVGSSVIILAMQPLFAGLFAFLFLRERPARLEYAGLIVAFAGLVLITQGDIGSGGLEGLGGDLLALLAAVLFGAYLTVGRVAERTTDAFAFTTIVFAVAAGVTWLAVLITRPAVGGFAGETWMAFALLALVPVALGYTAINWALGRLRVVTVATAVLAEAPLAIVFSVFVLGERPTTGILIGGALAIAGVGIALAARRTLLAPPEPHIPHPHVPHPHLPHPRRARKDEQR